MARDAAGGVGGADETVGMSSDKRRHERARCDILLRRLAITASFVRPGDDKGEPDMIYALGNGETLGIEVATAYYSDADAQAEWTLVRGARPSPAGGTEALDTKSWPDDLIHDRLQAELIDKCGKRYVGADHIWLCLHEHTALSNHDSVADSVRRLRVPRTHGFEAIYLTYVGSIDESDDIKVFRLFGRA